MTITIVSILIIAALAWVVNRILSTYICPICAGVSGTWLGLLALRAIGYAIDPAILALLMGGSVVGIAYQIEKRLPIKGASWQTPFLWKTLFIPSGFFAVYNVIIEEWGAALIAVVLLALVAIIFLRKPQQASPSNDATRKALEEKMKNCC